MRPKLLVAVGLVLAALALYATWPHLTEDPEGEAAEIARLLEAAPGSTLADVGAGDGRIALPLARIVAPGGVYATEIEPEKRLAIRNAATDADLDNVLVVQAQADRTNLPDACCDGVLLRKSYHHLPQPEAIVADLFRAVKPGGRVVLIDFTPESHWFLPRPDSAPDSRRGHGVRPEAAIAEMTAAGFRLAERIDSWPGRNYCLVFERPAE